VIQDLWVSPQARHAYQQQSYFNAEQISQFNRLYKLAKSLEPSSQFGKSVSQLYG
jgi:hypothetical protein